MTTPRVTWSRDHRALAKADGRPLYALALHMPDGETIEVTGVATAEVETILKDALSRIVRTKHSACVSASAS